jgi:hypothetical protein
MTGFIVPKFLALQNLRVEYLQFLGGDFPTPLSGGHRSC